jgi:hypothetical protein
LALAFAAALSEARLDKTTALGGSDVAVAAVAVVETEETAPGRVARTTGLVLLSKELLILIPREGDDVAAAAAAAVVVVVITADGGSAAAAAAEAEATRVQLLAGL